MSKPITENMIPKWIADIFKTKKEKRSEQDQLDLDRYVADLRFSDPEKYERLQAILKHVDPDTQHLPAGLNTNMRVDESIFDDIKAAGFKTWLYKDPSSKVFIAKGRTPEEAAVYLKMKYPSMSNIDLANFEDTGRGAGYLDDYVKAIYNQEQEAPERGQTPFFMKEIKNKLRKLVKELAADLPPTEKVSTMPGQDIKDQMVSAVSSTNDPKVLMQLAVKFGGAGFKQGDNIALMKKKLTPLMKNAGASEYLKLAQSFAVEDGEIVSKSNKQDIMFTNVKENKMKVNQLKQIIREEISKVLNEEKRFSSFEEWKEKAIKNPKLKNLSDKELKHEYDEQKRDYELMRRELDNEY